MATSLYLRISDIVRAAYNRRIVTPAVLDASAYFPASRAFAGMWEKLRCEAMAVAEGLGQIPRFHEIMAEQAPISDNDGRDWRLFILKAYGIEFPNNMAKCPLLAELVRTRPEVLSASITFLGPRKHIPQHRGPFRGVLRFYLGLSVPQAADGEPAVMMVLDGRNYRLGNGKWLLWDDTYPHEVWNESDEVRIALFLDIWRPYMPLDLWIMSKAILAITQVAILWRGVAEKYQK
jgi:aspartate beta-hydroxylase